MLKITQKIIDKRVYAEKLLRYLSWETSRVNSLKNRKESSSGQVYLIRKSAQGGAR